MKALSNLKDKWRFIIAFVICCFALGCTGRDMTEDKLIGEQYDKICIEGHVYYQLGRQLAIKLSDDGKPIKCGK